MFALINLFCVFYKGLGRAEEGIATAVTAATTATNATTAKITTNAKIKLEMHGYIKHTYQKLKFQSKSWCYFKLIHTLPICNIKIVSLL